MDVWSPSYDHISCMIRVPQGSCSMTFPIVGMRNDFHPPKNSLYHNQLVAITTSWWLPQPNSCGKAMVGRFSGYLWSYRNWGVVYGPTTTTFLRLRSYCNPTWSLLRPVGCYCNQLGATATGFGSYYNFLGKHGVTATSRLFCGFMLFFCCLSVVCCFSVVFLLFVCCLLFVLLLFFCCLSVVVLLFVCCCSVVCSVHSRILNYMEECLNYPKAS